jgi:enamine deaminase RidA (YjgF/YER057c/UK114 family)
MRTSLPDTLQAGDTWAWDATVDDYPSSEWTLKFVLHLRGSETRIEITATAASEGGNNYDVEVAATYTKDYPSGTYEWMAFVEKGAGGDRERYTVSGGGGTVRILSDLETADASTDARTHARKMLDAIETALEAAGSNITIVSLTVNGKSVQYKRDDLLKMRAKYRREVARERGESSIVGIQFGSA